jgi:Zn-dependent protease
VRRCASCGATAPESFVACPACHALFHAADLTKLVAEADASEAGGDLAAATTALRSALVLLPPASSQAKRIKTRIGALEERMPRASTSVPKWLGGLGAAGVGFWKLLGPLLAFAPKLKLLFAGLLQAKTVLSMLVTTAFYGGAGAGAPMLGLLASVYVHEMGHVFAFRRYGIEVSAPMFIPGFGAFVRGSHYPESPNAQADVALSGPIWGAASGLFALALSCFWDASFMPTIVILIAEVNAFNLVPVWQLDGSRAYATISRRDRLIVAAVGLVASVPVGSVMGMAASAGFALRAAITKDDLPSQPKTRFTLCALFVVLALMRGVAVALME